MQPPSGPPPAPEPGPGGPWYRRLHWQVLMAMALGATVGLAFGPAAVPWVGWLGTLFVKLLKMVILPLVVASIVSGVASVGAQGIGRLFAKTLGYYFLSSMLAILVGLVVVNLIRPGDGGIRGIEPQEIPRELTTVSSPVDLLLNIVPENVAAAATNFDMLSVIFFSIVFAIAAATLPDRPRATVIGFFDAVFQVMMKLTSAVMMLLPLGVFGLLTRVVAESGFDAFRALGLYMLTVALGLTIHLFAVLPLLLLLLGRIKPWVHFRNMLEPLLVAFSTSSSAATLPVTLRTVENRVGVSNRVSSFVLPMGATVNMDGTALYECAGVLFIAQVLGVGLGPFEQLLVVITALLASIGAAAVPSAGLVIIFIVLNAVNLHGPQVEAIVGSMLAVDRILDMYRTSVNVYSDSCGAAIIARSEGEVAVDAEVRA